MTLSLAAQIERGERTELGVHVRQHRVECATIAAVLLSVSKNFRA